MILGQPEMGNDAARAGRRNLLAALAFTACAKKATVGDVVDNRAVIATGANAACG